MARMVGARGGAGSQHDALEGGSTHGVGWLRPTLNLLLMVKRIKAGDLCVWVGNLERRETVQEMLGSYVMRTTCMSGPVVYNMTVCGGRPLVPPSSPFSQKPSKPTDYDFLHSFI